MYGLKSSAIKYDVGASDTRPWGTWTVLYVGPNYIIKQIDVKPGEKLSLQWHHHRNEHWHVLSGRGVVTLGDEQIDIQKGSSVDIPKTVHHRVENTDDKVLKFIEIQIGDILDEDDIVRVDDIYGRVS